MTERDGRMCECGHPMSLHFKNVGMITADQWVIGGPFADIGERTLTSAEEAGRG